MKRLSYIEEARCLKVNAPTVHITLHSAKRFGASRRHLQEVSYLTVRFFDAPAVCKHLSKRGDETRPSH